MSNWRAGSQRGFTLIELMVVVALVGVLASVGGVQWIRSQRRTQQGEAKVGLASLYAAQKNFYARYSAFNPADLPATGFRPDDRRRYQYWLCEGAANTRNVTGIATTPVNSNYAATLPLPAWSGVTDCAWGTACGVQTCNAGKYNRDNPQQFEAASATQFCAGCAIDVWAISETKNLRNTSNGTR